jgi:protease-4
MQPDTDTRTAAYVVAVVAALVVSAVLAPVVWDYGTRSDGSVAVVPVQGFVSSSSVDAVTDDLREARQNDSIDAVVLKVDSPGGSAAASERLYMAVQRTAEELPVVASVQSMGASGAYYGMLPAERIYVTPSSMVGSVGVRGVVPAPAPSYEVRSGPDKASGTMQQRREQIETLQRAFVGSVMKHRGESLEISREQVAHAKVYTGARAVENGMADQIGPLAEAVDAAAASAGLSDYDVAEMEPPRRRGIVLASATDNRTVAVDPGVGYRGVDTTRLLMVHGRVQLDGEVIVDGTA